jgi:hypothetical protein
LWLPILPNSVRILRRYAAWEARTTLPIVPATCCSTDKPFCTCVGCASIEELAATTCLVDEIPNCCHDAPITPVPPGEGNGDCCPTGAQCCGGTCLSVEIQIDMCDDVSCCADDHDSETGVDGCCTVEEPICACAQCVTAEELPLISCSVEQSQLGCCDADGGNGKGGKGLGGIGNDGKGGKGSSGVTGNGGSGNSSIGNGGSGNGGSGDGGSGNGGSDSGNVKTLTAKDTTKGGSAEATATFQNGDGEVTATATKEGSKATASSRSKGT